MIYGEKTVYLDFTVTVISILYKLTFTLHYFRVMSEDDVEDQRQKKMEQDEEGRRAVKEEGRDERFLRLLDSDIPICPNEPFKLRESLKGDRQTD